MHPALQQQLQAERVLELTTRVTQRSAIAVYPRTRRRGITLRRHPAVDQPRPAL